MTPELPPPFAGYQQRVADGLDACLPAADTLPARLHEAMRYATRGGKRLRAMLVYATAEALELELELVDRAAIALELIHAYSLVHDDLPAMDDDDLRRGQPTCHRAFDEATAILVGDALQALAFELLAEPAEQLPAEQRLQMVELLAQASGSHGMCGGQAMDLQAVGRQLDIAQVEAMHIRKTGALIRASVLLACCARQELPEAEHQALDHFAKCLGLAFQIQDDVLDEEGNTELLGKQAGADRHLNKPTFTAVLGLAAARERALELFDEARASLAPLGERAHSLAALSLWVQQRRH